MNVSVYLLNVVNSIDTLVEIRVEICVVISPVSGAFVTTLAIRKCGDGLASYCYCSH